mgnify:CR=1 FL=1
MSKKAVIDVYRAAAEAEERARRLLLQDTFGISDNYNSCEISFGSGKVTREPQGTATVEVGDHFVRYFTHDPPIRDGDYVTFVSAGIRWEDADRPETDVSRMVVHIVFDPKGKMK